MKLYYIDIGSSTIKINLYELNILTLIEERSIFFKEGFSKEFGISQQNLNSLYNYFSYLQNKYDFRIENTYIFATGIFREIPQIQKSQLIKYFSDNFNLYFNIISHGIENYYLGKAMEHNYNNKKVMIINMGGKTTEIITYLQNKIIDRKNLKIGVGDLLSNFSNINEPISPVKIKDIVEFVKEKIKDVSFDSDYDCAIFTGGELRFESLAGYILEGNDLFDDGIHNKKITLENFIKGNQRIFYQMTIDQLRQLMPQNSKWMDGARAGTCLPQAIFEKANITTIIPSDLNLINGVIKDF